MTNLLLETITKLADNSKTPDDVRWVGSSSYAALSWEEFTVLADVEYDSGFGAAHVPSDLVVVGNGWWLERYEYDGAEEWEYKTTPRKPRKPKGLVTKLTGGMWNTLEELQSREDDY